KASVRDAPRRHGIDFVEVITRPAAIARRLLVVWFARKSTAAGEADLAATISAIAAAWHPGDRSVRIEAGSDRPAVQVTSVELRAGRLFVRVDSAGDYG